MQILPYVQTSWNLGSVTAFQPQEEDNGKALLKGIAKETAGTYPDSLQESTLIQRHTYTK